MAPTVSVIIPTYNRAVLLRDAIESVMAQSYRDFEVIVVDDGSSDDTYQVVAQFGNSVRYCHQLNRGRSAARNHGIQKAHGRYLLFLDSDDLLLPMSLELLADFLDRHDEVGVVYSDAVYCDLDGNHLERVSIEEPSISTTGVTGLAEQLAVSNVVGPIHSAMVRREWLDRLDPPGFDESLEVWEDTDLWLRLAVAGCSFRHMEELTCRYRIHPGNTNDLCFAGHPGYRQAYSRSRLKVFGSDVFLRLLPSTQLTFLYGLLLHPVYGDASLQDKVISSDRFDQLPAFVQSQLLYLVAIDDLLQREDHDRAMGYLDRAAALRPHRIKYSAARWLARVSPQVMAQLVSTIRKVRSRKSVSPAPSDRRRSVVAGDAGGSV